MIDPLIIYTSEIDTVTKQMIDDYWGNMNGIFFYTVKDLSVKYNTSSTSILNKVKRVSGYNKKLKNCTDCNTSISIMTFTREEYKYNNQENKRCKICSKIYDDDCKETSSLNKLKFLDEVKPQMNQGITEKSWIGLNSFENDVLIDIINCREVNLIYENVLNKNFDVYRTWIALHKLEKLNLVFMQRGYGNGVLDFHFDDRLESIMKADRQKRDISQIIKDTFSFNLNKCHKDMLNTEADYSGSFILEHDIILKGNTFFKYEAFIQSDGSISFKCAPSDQFLNRTMDDGYGQTFYTGKSKMMDDQLFDNDPPF